jgi:hypothetical protein
MTLPLAITLILLAIYLVGILIGWWGVFEKAGEPGWAALVPGYNLYVLTRIAGLPWGWVFVFLIPLVNVGLWVVVCDHLALKFGKGIGTSLGLSCLGLVFTPLLGFGPDQHEDGPRPRRREEEEPPRRRRRDED